MVDTRGAINEFMDKLGQLKDKWEIYVINPYATAYDSALASYNSTLEKQKQEDLKPSLALELCLVALSLCGGGVLTAAFGTTAIKSLVVNKGVSWIAEKNMERAFQAAHYVATNKTANFIAGELWSKFEAGATSYVSDKVKPTLQPGSSFPSTLKLKESTIQVQNALTGFIGEAKIKAWDIAEGIRDSAVIPDDLKLSLIDMMRKSHFHNPPSTKIDTTGLEDEIELAMYMLLLMQSDYYTEIKSYPVTYYEGRAKMQGFRTERTKIYIEENPSARSYPGNVGASNNAAVSYERVGGIIMDRVHELHKKKFGEPFSRGVRTMDPIALLHAEQTIGRLASAQITKKIGSVQ